MSTAGIACTAGHRDEGRSLVPGSATPAPAVEGLVVPLEEQSSEMLVRACQSGSAEAFDALVDRHAGAVYGYLLRFTGNPHDAEDLTQDTFLKAHRGLPRFQSARAFVPWLFTIARRTALNHFRSRRPTEELHPDMVATADGGAPDDSAGRADLAGSLWKLAGRLKPQQYEALWLHYGEGLDIEQVARVMRKTRLNVRVLLHRARQELRRRLSGSAWAEEVLPTVSAGLSETSV
ncbi:MAG: sigma-70 family RNA polymerase sigma factor [Verrucomicrobiae bacterium]|nr:sigma-70 family RNA polymerase sigma factor [Verrucomicrobiae bacterium]MCP5520432.1 sigma-70 family RNA polymerase sigma factor [Verrucomicrobiales bacterium]